MTIGVGVQGSAEVKPGSMPLAESGRSELIDPIVMPALASGLDQALGFDSRFDAIDDSTAVGLAETICRQQGLEIGFGSIRGVFQSDDVLLEHLAKTPLAMVQVKDDITGNSSLTPVMESEQASLIRDRMLAAGIVPVYLSGSQLMFAVRVDSNFETNAGNIFGKDLPAIIEELDKITENSLNIQSAGLWPVSKATYDLISNALVDPVYRDRLSIDACDAHFKFEYAQSDEYFSSSLNISGLRETFGNNPVNAIIRLMHFEPFIGIQEKETPSAAEASSAIKDSLGLAVHKVSSIFDKPKDPKINFLLERSRRDGFLPIRMDRDQDNRIRVVLGFNAYEQGEIGTEIGDDFGFKKVSLVELNERLLTYVETLKNAFKDHLPADFSAADIRLVPVPNQHMETLNEHINDPVRRKNTLKIVDKPNGILNYQMLVDHAVRIGAQEIYLQIFDSGPRIRFGIGASIVTAPFSFSVDAFERTVLSLSAQMSNKNNNYNQGIEGNIRFSGAKSTDFGIWEKCFAKGETPPVIAGSDNNLNVYPQALHGISLRLQYLPLVSGAQMVIRIHRMQKSPPALSELGLRPEARKAIEHVMKINSGLVLFVAPTGSGKSTLMASILSSKNSPGRAIMTMENPVEFRIDGIAQVDINEAAGRGQKHVLSAFLRSAPGIIMIGEIRDKEDADIALKAGLTGHLLLSTLHTNDAPEAMIRLMGLEVDRFFLSSAVNAIVSQRLIPQFKPQQHSLSYKPDPSVVERYDCRSEIEGLIGRKDVFDMPVYAYRARESKVESGEAYKGRVPVNEVIVPTPELKALFSRREGWDMNDLLQTLRTQQQADVPFEPMVVGGLRWVLEGRTSLSALYEGEKVIPVGQFAIYADEIIKAVKEFQHRSMH